MTIARSVHLLIVVADFYKHIADLQLDGAISALQASGLTQSNFDVIKVPGALEIPPIISYMARDHLYDGYIALGCVIRGETTHYDIVSQESSRALMDLGIMRHIPIGNGILTVENEHQALERADKTKLDKAGGATMACLCLINNFKHLRLIPHE